jgi:uncharacterized protein involved in type VI secretion and phage assembly
MTAAKARAATTDRKYYGVAEGIVEDVADPDRENKVRVRFPWFDDTEVSDWCRMANTFAGNGYGSTWTPEVGDEVLVAFVHGDMRVPVLLGGLYNGADKPADPRTAQDNKKAGHLITLNDSAGSLGIEVRTNDGNRVHLDDNADTITVEIPGGPSVTLGKNGGTLALKATSISIEATSIKIAASGTLEATGHPIKLN